MENVIVTLCVTIIALCNHVSVYGQFHQAQHLPQHKDLQRGYRLSKSHEEIEDFLSQQDFIPKQYAELANIFLQKLKNVNNGTQCQLDTYQVLKDLTKGSLYALKFLDSFAKPPPGILDGHINWLGSYDECKMKVVVNASDYFESNYCRVTVSIPKLDKVMKGGMLSMGICVPSSCSENETETFTDFGVALLQPVVGNISTHGVTCDRKLEWKTSTYIAILVTAVLIALALIGTLCDVIRRWWKSRADETVPVQWNGDINEPNNHYDDDNDVGLIDIEPEDDENLRNSAQKSVLIDKVMDILVCFSWISNGQKLLNSSVGTDYLGAINGIRFLSMSWIILGHTYYFAVQFVSNTATGFEIVKRFSFQAVMNASVSVDSFFFLSGLLVCYLTMNELRKNEGHINWFLFYFHRYWRLTPAYMYVILIFAGIFPLLIKGPFVVAGMEQGLIGEGICDYWWSNLLYINNFVPSDLAKGCLGWSWYLADDMQFYVISPILVYLLYRFVFVGVSVITALIIVCLALTGEFATKYHVSAFPVSALTGGGNHTADDARAAEEYMKIYIRPFHRIAPYLVGMLTGYALYRYKDTFKPHWMVNVFGWCCATGINLSVIYGLYHYSSTLTPIPQGISSAYIAASRFGWSLGLAWLSFACITGNGGPINAILSYGLWAPLGRLTYCAFLVHPIVMFVVYLDKRTPIYFSDISTVYYFLGHLVLAYAVAFVVSLLIESPMMALEKLFLPKKDSAKTK